MWCTWNRGRVRLEKTRGSAFPSSPETWQRLGLQAGLNTSHKRGPWGLDGNVGFIGRSEQEEALRFGTDGNDAPRLDMTDFLLELSHGEDHRVALGHVSFGAHRLLADNVSHRGAAVSSQLTEHHEVRFTALRGNAIVGYDHLLGISQRDHRIYAASWAFTPRPDVPLAPRLELTWMDAAILPLDNFDTGQVRDAERSRGIGLSVTGLGERLEYQLLHALSRFSNPDDPLLDQGLGLVSVRSDTADASAARFLWRKPEIGRLGEAWPVTVEIETLWDRSDPLYRTVGAWVEPDRENAALRMSTFVGPIQLQAGYRQGRDNLDELVSLLTTRTREINTALAVPLTQIAGPEAGRWLPDLSAGWQRVYQFAGNVPDPLLSGFAATHLPDQVTRLTNLQAAWYRQSFDVFLGLTRSQQDNRQVGRERADFDNKDVNGSITWRVSPGFDVGLNTTLSSNRDREFALTRRTHSFGVNLNWYASDRLSFAVSLFDQKQTDSRDENTSRNLNADVQASWSFAIRWDDTHELPGQFFLRWGHQDNRFTDRVFDVDDRGRTWVINSGFSLTVF